MTFATRKEAVEHWVPELAVVLYDFESTIVYLHDSGLVVLRVFALGGPLLPNTWHVSVDVDKSFDELERLQP